MRNWGKKKKRTESGRLIERKEEKNQEWKIQRNKGIMWSAYNKDTKSSWRRQYVGRRASCQRFNLKREELLAVINVSYRERKSRWRKFLFNNSTVTSHTKRISYQKKKKEDQDTRRRIKTEGSYRNSTTHAWAAGNPRAREAKCWGSKLTTAQGPKKKNNTGLSYDEERKKERRKGWESPKDWGPKTHEGKRL